MQVTPIQVTAIETMLNGIAGMFLPAPVIVALQDIETAYNIVTGANPPAQAQLFGKLTNHLSQQFGLYVIPMGAPGTTVTITF